MPADSPVQNARKRKASRPIDVDLTPGGLQKVFTEAKETQPGHLQLLNWRYRTLNNNDNLCCTLSDGAGVTKHVEVEDDLEDIIKEAPLYSVIRVTEATIIDGCMLLLEELEVLSTTPIQPVVFRDEMFHLDKKFVMDILISRGMFENGANYLSNDILTF